jgi:hypothetical protein
LRAGALVLGLSVCVPNIAQAQDFGLMESAETIDRGTFKLRVNPMIVFGKDDQGQDTEGGVAAMIGYGVTDRFDLEGGVALYDGFTFVGLNGEYWLMRDPIRETALDLSVIGGIHSGRGSSTPDTVGFDLSVLASKRLNERLEFYGGLDLAFENVNDSDESFTPVHIVPGLEYRMADDLDLVGEFGIGLNDEARHYLSVGIAYYFR